LNKLQKANPEGQQHKRVKCRHDIPGSEQSNNFVFAM
jgi:hypothetical protein